MGLRIILDFFLRIEVREWVIVNFDALAWCSIEIASFDPLGISLQQC